MDENQSNIYTNSILQLFAFFNLRFIFYVTTYKIAKCLIWYICIMHWIVY